jgi:hypothetical protein
MPHNAMSTVRQPLFAETGNKRIRIRHQCFSKHTSRTLARNFCQRIINLFRLAEGQYRSIFFHGVSLLVRFWQALTPATIRRLQISAITQIRP